MKQLTMKRVIIKINFCFHIINILFITLNIIKIKLYFDIFLFFVPLLKISFTYKIFINNILALDAAGAIVTLLNNKVN